MESLYFHTEGLGGVDLLGLDLGLFAVKQRGRGRWVDREVRERGKERKGERN